MNDKNVHSLKTESGTLAFELSGKLPGKTADSSETLAFILVVLAIDKFHSNSEDA